MTQQQKVILAAGAAGAVLIWHSRSRIDPKTGKRIAPKSGGLLSNLLPTRGTNSPALASTNMATRGGTATVARVPSSGLGFPQTSRGVGQPPTAAVAGIAAGGSIVSSLLNFLARRKPATSSQPQPQQRSSGGGVQASPNGGSGGSKSAGGMGGSGGVAAGGNSDSATEITGGHFDQNGNWINDSETPIQGGSFDESGNWIPDDTTPIVGGSFDADGNWISDDQFQPGGDLFVGPIQQDPGAVDENGNFDPNADPAVEVLPTDDVLGSTPIGTGDFDGNIFTDPITLDAGGLSGVDDGSAFAADDSAFANIAGGAGSETDDPSWESDE